MFKKLAIASVLGTAMLGGPGFAATVGATANFSVNVTLTPACKITSTDTAIALTYTAFQTDVAKDDAVFSVSCTSGQSYSVAVKDHVASYSDSATGLAYTLNLGTTANTSGATASVGSQIGDGNAKNFYVTGTIASGLAGATSASSAPIQHTLEVSY